MALSSPQNGESDILSYNLEWDQGSNTWVEITGESEIYLLESFVKTSEILAGETYGFRVRALNSLGWGTYSDVTYIKAATKPSQMQAP